jgi:hypothetical protein
MSPGYRSPVPTGRQTMRTPALERAAGVLASEAIASEMWVEGVGFAGTDQIVSEMRVDPIGGLLSYSPLTHSTYISGVIRGTAVARSPLPCGCDGAGATGRAAGE